MTYLTAELDFYYSVNNPVKQTQWREAVASCLLFGPGNRGPVHIRTVGALAREDLAAGGDRTGGIRTWNK
jgi:hypothetical protein